MKKSNTLLKSIFSLCLTIVMVISVCPVLSSAGVVTVIDPEQKLQYLYTFNDAVNGIKENRPSFKYRKTAGMSSNDDDYYYQVGSNTAADLADEARKYLSVVIDACFNPDRGIVKNFIGALAGTNSEYTEREFIKGSDTKYYVPLYGEDYVSALTVDDTYTLKVEESQHLLDPSKNTLTMRYQFDDCDLESVKVSSLQKAFDLPSGSIDPVIISGGTFADSEGPLSEVKFDNFTFTNAYVQAQFNADGELINYTQNISYTFSLTFYDLMRVFGAFTKIDLVKIALAIANPILENTGNPTVEARDILKDSAVYIKYDIKTELWDFDWDPRYFGDIDNDGTVDSSDARSALRYSVGLEEYKEQESLIYGDVDFDGVIASSDARHILRTSVNLEKLFSEVPEGESIKIVVVVPPVPDTPDEPSEPEKPEEPENPDEPGDTDKPDLPSSDDVAEGISDFVNAIFDVINDIRGDNVTGEGIAGLIQQIKDIVQAGIGAGDNNEGGGFIPYESENA
ncbi:MAG: hypothetical protein E7573_10340 [Ruminococcaceae bacterium]|nr:hypothetical protein [Oscillospiraceae bacterium]MBR3597984.1 hypothetical protein [Clostridia bacterium]